MSSGDKRDRQPGSEDDSRSSKRSRAPDGPLPDHGYTRDQYTIGWLCALPIEMAAAKVMLDKIHPNLTGQDPEDHNTYLLGEVWGHNIAVACLPAGIHGTTTAATVAKDMRRSFRSIRFGIMVGIGGGIPSESHDIRLGDVVVSQPTATSGGVIQHDRGKLLQEQGFERTGMLNAPPQVVLAALSRLQAEHFTEDSRIGEFLANLSQRTKKTFSHPGVFNDCLFLTDYPHIKDNPTCGQCDSAQTVKREDRDNTEPVIHYGTIASGNQVIKDAKLRDQLAERLGALCCEMEAAGLQDFPSVVVRGICDYSDSHKNKKWQPYAAAVAAAFAKELLYFMPPSRVLQVEPIPQLVTIATESLDVSKQHLEVSSKTLGEQKRTNQILEGRALDLHVVHEACYNSADVGESPRCEANTRVRIQLEIRQWADKDGGEPLLWLVGPAGTVKSTLIRSVADTFQKRKRLVAGYFFKRGHKGRNDTNRLFSTLAIQLAEAIPSFKDNLRLSVGDTDRDSMEKKDLRFQFETLIKTPLADLPPSDRKNKPKLIVIDALDECERTETLPRILNFISEICNNSTASNLRVLLTSRPDPRIFHAFEPLMKGKKARTLQLHRMFSANTKSDIRLYLETNFKRIKAKANIHQDPWPTLAELNHLVKLSTNPEPLFIYAATLLRFVYDEKRLRSPKIQLKTWIKQCEDNKSQLHQMYDPILEQVIALEKDADLNPQRQFLGALVLTALPLSVTALTSLLGLDIDDVNWWLPSLQAVLDIPPDLHKPLKLHHKSFSDFLLSEGNPGHDRFKVDARDIHALLANRCIRLMERTLKRDICDLRKLDAAPQDITQHRLSRCIPLELEYSCRFWVYHLRASGNITSGQITCTSILAFLLRHFLHWVEVLALLMQTSDALKALQDLSDLVKNSDEGSSQLVEFLKDATRTVSSFATIIESAPLQTYASLLLFSSPRSRVGQRLWDQRLSPLSYIEGVKPGWDEHMQTIEVPGNVKALAFSPNDKFLASADTAVRLWNASTGQHLISFENPEFHPLDVVFSPSSQLLAATYSEGSVSIWDMTTWTHLPTIWGPTGGYISIAISSDDKALIAAQSYGRIQRFHIRTGFHLRMEDFVVSTARIFCKSVSISSGLPLLVYHVGEYEIMLWNMETFTKYVFRTNGKRVTSVALSPNGQFLAGACEGAIFLWDTATHRRDCIMDESEDLYTITFSSHSQSLVAHSVLRTRFWNMATGSYRDLKLGYQNAIAFSSDIQTLATASKEKAIKLRDLGYANIQQNGTCFEAGTAAPDVFLFSPNSRLVVSQQGRNTPQLWNSLTGELLRSPTHEADRPDAKLPALGLPQNYESARKMEGGAKMSTLERQIRALRSDVSISPESQLAAALYNDNDGLTSDTIQIYDTTTGSRTYTLDLAAKLERMCLFPNDQLYDATGHPITLDHTARVEVMAFSPNGQFLALSVEGGTILLWDTKLRAFQRIIRQFYTSSSCTLVFSPNGEMLAAMSTQIPWWDVTTGICQNTIYPGGFSFLSTPLSPSVDLLGPAETIEDDRPRTDSP